MTDQQNKQDQHFAFNDGESDHVLLGSCFDDTRTNVEAAGHIVSDRQHYQNNNLERIEDADERDFESGAKTKRVHEEWRRAKLVDQMQKDELENEEDDQAQAFPIHKRFVNQNNNQEAEMETENLQPTDRN